MDILEAMGDPNLFGRHFPGPTWSAWRVVLRAIFGLPLLPGEFELYRECTGRGEPPAGPAREAWLVVGRRGGKSRIAALVAVFLAVFRDYSDLLAPGERGTVMILAADRLQARTVLRYVKALLAIPMLTRLVERETAEGLELTNRTSIEVATASYRTTRGYTVVAAILDEIAFWRDETSANPDREIVAALRPGMATVPGALLLAISSPYARRGLLWESHGRHFARDGEILVWQAPSRTMNPELPERIVEQALEEDEAANRAEYLAEFRRDVETFVAREVLEAAVEPGVRELPPAEGVEYVAFVDPSGGSADSMALAVAHGEGVVAVLDLVREWKPPFSPDAVVHEICGLLGAYGCREVRGDRYGAAWVRERFEKGEVRYAPSELSKSDLYRELLPALNSGKVRLLDDRRLLGQLVSLERRTARGGRDSIDHGPRGHDDLANAVAGAIHFARTGQAEPVRLWGGAVPLGPRDDADRIRELVEAGGGAWFPEDGQW